MYHLTLEEFYKDNKELAEARFKQIDPVYFETCVELLESIKLLTFSWKNYFILKIYIKSRTEKENFI